MPSRSLKTALAVAAILVFVAIAFTGGLAAGWLLPVRPADLAARLSGQPAPQASPAAQLPQPPLKPTPTLLPGNSGGTPTDLKDLFVPFWQAWQLVHREYIDQPVDDTLLMQGAIRGMLSALGDPHTSYMDPEMYRQVQMPMDGGYDGIGAWVDSNQEFLTIVSPMPGSPAENGGLKPGDQVLAVDGTDVTGLDGSLVIRQVMGPAGTKVTLTIRREGVAEPFDVTLVRERIDIPTVEARMLEGKIAYVALYTFGETTREEFEAALAPLLKQDPAGLILDLRGNGGGYLDTAIEIGSEFIPSGAIVYERYGDGSEQTFTAREGGLATRLPLVVLVDEGSASASEIVAGAIQDTGRGKLVGVKTYGKGSVQDWVELKNGQGAARVTIAHWYTPNHRLIDQSGLVPDVEVQLTDADIEAKNDAQLKQAIQLLTTTP